MTQTPPSTPPQPAGSRTALIAVAVIVVVLVAVGVGIAIGRSHHSTTSTTTSTPSVTTRPRKGRKCGKHRQKKGLCTPTSTTAPGESSLNPPPGGALEPLALTNLHSKMGLATGTQLWDAAPSEVDTEMAGIAASGAQWVRTSLHWSGVEPTSADSDDWSQADRIVTDAQKDHVNVIFDIDNAPAWSGGGPAGEFGSSAQNYADFAAKVATRYRNTVRVFELGNEPNHSDYNTDPSPATYTALLKLTYPAIKHADPNAFVLVGGIGGIRDSNGDIDPVTFVKGLYQDGAKGFFDGLAYHPYTYPELPTTEITTGDKGWSRMLQVRAVMVQNGDSAKPIWVTEFGAPTNGPGGVSQQQQAAILQNGFNLWQTYAWGGVICWFSYEDKGDDPSTHKDWFGLVDSSGTHKSSYATYSGLAHTS